MKRVIRIACVTRRWFIVFTVATLAIVYFPQAALAQASHVQWDIISLTFDPVSGAPIASSGGIASARAADNSMITMTGTGTFVAPAGGAGSNASATGGGIWEIIDAAENLEGSGMYWVTGLVRWDREPAGVLPSVVVDAIGNPDERSAGLAVLRIQYDDGSRGILVVNCTLPGSPATIPEGISATKGFVDYFDVQLPATDEFEDANRTIFHVRGR